MSTGNTQGQEHAVLSNFLLKLGLEKFYPNKLTLRSLLEINRNSIYEEADRSLEKLPWCFLRKLFQINAECRDSIQLSNSDDDINEIDQIDQITFDLYTADDPEEENEVNPLDLIVALFLCADSFLQQEMVLKMTMCQFSVPLLLPHGNNSQCKLMLWALRDIVKEWRPHHLTESRGFVENSIVQENMPFCSFVRLKNCSLSKSQVLNHVLGLGQCSHNIFIHREMKGRAITKKIANGLVEVCWYLPSGTENLDMFPGPVGFVNLRGDVCESLAQYSFLLEVSSATFIFLDKVEEREHKILTSHQGMKSKLFLILNRKDGNTAEDRMSVKTLAEELNCTVKIKDSKENAAQFSSKLCKVIRTSLTNGRNTLNVENMLDKAIELGLSVDEITSNDQKKAAEEIVKGIGVRHAADYKKQQLPLQGANWKTLSQLEMEECRLKDCSNQRQEEYKSQLQANKQKIRTEQSTYKLSKAMETLIESLSERDTKKRDFFLKWVKLKLDTHSRKKISELRGKFTEQCKKKDAKLIAELDQALLESSLGIEHYLREMGLTYEFSNSNQIAHLPVVAAEMLLDGYPLELLDGDASNIPERWVTDVLVELHKKVGEKSRLLVLTVLGVQSTGKSTLLNTMFGVQFPVSSGRCTRGAYMLFLRVGEDMKNELNCDFIVLIDTEGLKSPHLAELEDSYEHDNQLATFVIGLSDVTIINVAMENSTEMKDVLQIATHAFVRMKKVGKKPVCHFVHQNVAAVSASAKLMTDRKHLLDQLNEMTKIAAEMEREPSVKAFTDILTYDIEKNNWNIPGLWYGTPPMAPVNTGYSEAVADFKRNLLEMVQNEPNHELSQIPEFLEWMKSLWKSVKHENFIFSFRNTLVAYAYNNLCKEFSDWEWEFRKEILSWQTQAELEISNDDNDSDLCDSDKLCDSKKSEASDKITKQQKMMDKKLQDYYKRKDRHVHLIEKYKTDFFNSIKGLAKEIQHSVNNKLDCAFDLRKSSKKSREIQMKYRTVIEKRVMKLLGDCERSTLSDEELTQEFEKMWTEVIVNVSGLKEQNISANILMQLRKNFLNRNVGEELENIGDLTNIGTNRFEVNNEHKIKKQNIFKAEDTRRELQRFADGVIKSCTRFVNDTAQSNKDYHDCFTKDLLEKIDESLKNCSEKCNSKFEIDLKLHICGIASREFVQMHRKFLLEKNPKSQLDKYKTQYLSDFLDLYKQRDDCQRKANNFVQFCIKPAVEDFINRSLGIEIVDDILTGSYSAECSSRSFFQYNILRQLLLKEDFESFVKYISKYETYVKDWISHHVVQKMLEDNTLCKLESKILQVIINKILKAIELASKGEDGVVLPDTKESITELISNMRKYLIKDISISVEAEKTTLFQIQSTCHPFINSLRISINDLKEELQGKFSNSEDVSEVLNKLPVKPQDELFNRVFGCGKQCPFCKVPCEAGGKEHKQHHAAVHRPLGLGSFSTRITKRLVEALCTTSVHSQAKFSNTDTQWKFHPYKDYTKFYPDWHIPPDPTVEASDYWKYVLVQYNDRFAQEYEAKPADVPKAWTRITQDQALKGLNDAFNIQSRQTS